MVALYVIVLLAIVGIAIFYICREYIHKPKKEKGESHAVMKNKKFIENMVANVESIIVYADSNDELCHRLVEVKDNIRFFNPTTNSKVQLVDQKIANRLDDLKILTAKDNKQETCFRVLEEIEAYIVQRKKEEKNT